MLGVYTALFYFNCFSKIGKISINQVTVLKNFVIQENIHTTHTVSNMTALNILLKNMFLLTLMETNPCKILTALQGCKINMIIIWVTIWNNSGEKMFNEFVNV